MLGFFVKVLYKIFPHDQNGIIAAKHSVSRVYIYILCYTEITWLFTGHS